MNHVQIAKCDIQCRNLCTLCTVHCWWLYRIVDNVAHSTMIFASSTRLTFVVCPILKSMTCNFSRFSTFHMVEQQVLHRVKTVANANVYIIWWKTYHFISTHWIVCNRIFRKLSHLLIKASIVLSDLPNSECELWLDLFQVIICMNKNNGHISDGEKMENNGMRIKRTWKLLHWENIRSSGTIMLQHRHDTNWIPLMQFKTSIKERRRKKTDCQMK